MIIDANTTVKDGRLQRLITEKINTTKNKYNTSFSTYIKRASKIRLINAPRVDLLARQAAAEFFFSDAAAVGVVAGEADAGLVHRRRRTVEHAPAQGALLVDVVVLIVVLALERGDACRVRWRGRICLLSGSRTNRPYQAKSEDFK